MITTNKNINLDQLNRELGNQGLIADFNDPNNKIIGVADNSTVTDEQLAEAIKVHIAIDDDLVLAQAKAAAAAKLAALGLTVEDLQALGL